MTLKQIAIVVIILLNAQAESQNGQSNCGRRLVQELALITNGYETKEGDWPWHAAIYHIGENYNIAYRCGGTILNSNSVLTAAHCVHESNRQIIAERLLVNLGQYNLKILGSNTQQFEVHSVIPHPNYNATDYSNDIAIIRLSTEARLTNYVQPVCLWESNKVALSEVIGRFGTVIGWGLTEKGKISHIQRQAIMPVVPSVTCLESNRGFYGNFLSDNNFCAGFRNGTSVCEGDSGGSMTFEENGVYRIRGIVSLTKSRQDNKPVCQSNEYVVFTDVAKYLAWIQDVQRQVQPSPSIGQPMVAARISARKCNYYKEFAYTNVTDASSVYPSNSIIKRESNCAFQTTYGVAEANKREFPHQARIIVISSNTYYWPCQGALISEQFVLSTAYCCSYTKYFPRFVRLGDHNSRTYEALRIDVNIIESIIHPSYQVGMWFNDIGLLKMERRVEFNSAIRPVCLPSQSAVTSKSAITSAWAAFDLGGIESDVLLKLSLNIVPQRDCSNRWGTFQNLSQGVVEEIQLCAGSPEDRRRFCKGYIGATLQTYHEIHHCTYTIVGVHNFGSYNCPDIQKPEVYTRVYAYLNWIESIVWPNE